jgi:hypothetical protein
MDIRTARPDREQWMDVALARADDRALFGLEAKT